MMKRFLRQAGFTMIELLVVIAVLGVLATAVLSAINPIEQINKGRDTGHRSDAEQLLNAVDRYFALHELYPWNDSQYNTLLTTDQLASEALPDAAGDNCTPVDNDGLGTFCRISDQDTASNTWLDALVDTAEVKESFVDRLRRATVGNALLLYRELGDTSSLTVCFRPQSQGFQKEATDNCEKFYASLPAGVCTGTYAGGVYTQSTDKTELLCL